MSEDLPRPNAGWQNRKVLALILLAACLMRLPALEHAPPPLNQDEASRLYDAWSILETGADRTGQAWLFFLESYGEGDFTAAITTYITVPFVAILGPTPLAVRLPDALLSVVTVGLVWSWLRRQQSARAATLAALFLALDPWHVLVTRTGWEFGYVPFFLAGGMLALHRSGLMPGGDTPSPRTGWAVAAGTLLAFSAWTYPATRMFTPLLCAGVVLCNLRFFRAALRAESSRRAIAAFCAAAVVAGAPLWMTLLRHPDRLAARAKMAMIDFSPAALPKSIPAAIGYYLSYFNPAHLVTHPEEITTIGIPGVGMHLIPVALLIPVGVVLIIRRSRGEAFARLLLLWLLINPIPAAICDDIQPHMIRVIDGMILWPMLAALAADWLLGRLADRPAARRPIVAGFAIGFAANAAFFAWQYYTAYPGHAELGLQTPLVRAIQYAVERKREVDFILITNRANQAYIYALLYGPIPPKQLRADPAVIARGPVNFHQVLRVGDFFFTPRDPVNYPDAQGLFKQAWDRIPPGSRGFVIEQPGYFPAGEIVKFFPWGEATEPPGGYEVRRWRKD